MRTHSYSARGAFTLVELMVVLAVVALLSAITLGVVSSLREGGKRGTCQTNLNQIYGAMRLYAQDFDGQFPYYNPSDGPTSPPPPGPSLPHDGMGLWALYAYSPGASNGDCNNFPTSKGDPLIDAPLAGYIKSPRALHCPNDDFVPVPDAADTCNTMPTGSAQLNVAPNGDGLQHLNPFFLSYQTYRPAGAVMATTPYSLFRGDGTTVKRQLRYYTGSGATLSLPDRRAADDTVVTWCRFHRHLDKNGNTISGDNSLDNVLFLDGSVQSIRVSQAITDDTGADQVCTGASRVPLSETIKRKNGCS